MLPLPPRAPRISPNISHRASCTAHRSPFTFAASWVVRPAAWNELAHSSTQNTIRSGACASSSSSSQHRSPFGPPIPVPTVIRGRWSRGRFFAIAIGSRNIHLSAGGFGEFPWPRRLGECPVIYDL